MIGGMVRALALLAVLVASMGTALAMWSETLLVGVNVQTGEVDVAFTGYSCSDVGADPQAAGFTNEEGKDVATCTVEVASTDAEGDTIELLVTISNAYPGYTVDISLDISNIGTIPVKLYTYSVSADEPIQASLSIPEDTQIDPGDSATYVLTITVPQEAAETSTYTVSVTLEFAQWNEVT